MINAKYRSLLTAIAVLGAGLLLAGCAGLGKSTHAVPSTIGQDVSISQLQKSIPEYRMYYSGWWSAPTALLFVPKQSSFTLRLVDWKRFASLDELTDLIRNIEDQQVPYAVRLKAIIPPTEVPAEGTEAIAYIYSKHSASLRAGGAANAFTLYGVSRRDNRGMGSDRFDFGDD